MTLPTNASAQAFGSTLTCLVNQTDQPTDYFRLTQSPYQTEPVGCIQVAHKDGSNREYLADFSGTGSECYDPTGKLWYPDKEWYVPADYVSGKKWAVEGTMTANAYVYVGEDGSYWGVHPSMRSQGGLAVYGSCYMSIMGVNA